MNSLAKLAVAAAAVVVVAVLGYNLLPGTGPGPGGPNASPTPTLSPTPSPTPLAERDFPLDGALAKGEHSMKLEGVRFTFQTPTADWVSNGSFGIDLAAGIGPDGAGFIFWKEAPVGVFSDPCSETMGPDLGTSAVDLADAVASIPETDLVSGPTDVTIGGRPAKQVVITIRDDIGCSPESFYLWYGPTNGNARYATQAGSTIRTWIIEVNGKIVWIDGETYSGAGPGLGEELQAIVDSIQFE